MERMFAVLQTITEKQVMTLATNNQKALAIMREISRHADEDTLSEIDTTSLVDAALDYLLGSNKLFDSVM